MTIYIFLKRNHYATNLPTSIRSALSEYHLFIKTRWKFCGQILDNSIHYRKINGVNCFYINSITVALPIPPRYSIKSEGIIYATWCVCYTMQGNMEEDNFDVKWIVLHLIRSGLYRDPRQIIISRITEVVWCCYLYEESKCSNLVLDDYVLEQLEIFLLGEIFMDIVLMQILFKWMT